MAEIVFHIAARTDWRPGTPYTPAMFNREGFVHCSRAVQLQKVARGRYAGRSDLVLLCIDTGRLDVPLRYENTEGGTELFPHVYGAINTGAVTAHDILAVDDGGNLLPGADVSAVLEQELNNKQNRQPG